MYTSHFVYPFIRWWVLGCSRLLATVNNVAMDMGVQISLWDPTLSYFGYVLRSGISGSYGILLSISWGSAIQCGCTILCPHQQCTTVPVSPDACRHFSLCFESSHPNVVRWYLIVVLISFLWRWARLSIFSCAYRPFVYLLWRNVYSSLLPSF